MVRVHTGVEFSDIDYLHHESINSCWRIWNQAQAAYVIQAEAFGGICQQTHGDAPGGGFGSGKATGSVRRSTTQEPNSITS